MLRAMLLLAFVCSGAAGLVYELVWSRYLTLFVGHSAEAQVLVIGMFLGGMSVGALVTAERSARLRRPLRAYALIELALAVVGLSFHAAFGGVTELAYSVIFPAIGAGAGVWLAKWALASAMVFLPSLLLGATFPLMAAGVLRAYPDKPGGTISALYFANSLGGAIGILGAGFILIAAVGLPGTSAGGAVLNLLAAGGALVVSRRLRGATTVEAAASAFASDDNPAGDPPTRPAADADEPSETEKSAGTGGEGTEGGGGVPSPLWRLLLAVSALTAVASFIYEIGWIRMLSLVMGSATHAFELMLSAFILGLALGALAIRRRADRAPRPLVLLGRIQWAMGMLALATLPLYVASFDWMAELVSRLPETDAGYRTFNLARYGVALVIMFPATALAGMTLPVITTALLRAGAGERAIGWVYAVNTAGAIAGVMLAGLVLMPLIGLKGMLIAGAALDIGLGILLLGRASASPPAVPSGSASSTGWTPRRGVLLAAGVAGLALLGAAAGLRFDQALLTSGVYRYGQVEWETQPILYYADGRTATIGVHVTGPDTLVVLTSNGKPDASLTARWIRAAREPVDPAPIEQQDESTQMLAALVTTMHGTGGRAAVIGHGSGVSGHFLLADPRIESLVTIEIEPRVVDASYVYYPANARAFDDPRSSISIADAKSYFAYSGVTYDLILSEPSNPWVSGTSSLFSREFYERVREYLTPTGVFGQWFHFYEMSDDLVTTVLVALHESFPAYRAYLVGDSDMLIVATIAPELPLPDWSLLDDPSLREELSHVPPLRPHHMDGLRVFERGDLDPLLRNRADGNSDYRPILDLGAERARYLGLFASGVAGLSEDRFRIAAALGGWRLDPAPEAGAPILGLEPLVQRSRAARARGLVAPDDEGPPATAAPVPAETGRGGTLGFGLLPPPLAPADTTAWARWLRGFFAADARRHAGSAGYADTAFFQATRTSLREVDSPDVASRAVDLVAGVSAWDFDSAATAARALLDGDRDGSGGLPLEVLPLDLMLDASVVSALRVGDAELAERAYERYATDTGRSDSDFRLELLRAHIARVRAQGGDAIRSDVVGVASGSGPSLGTSP